MVSEWVYCYQARECRSRNLGGKSGTGTGLPVYEGMFEAYQEAIGLFSVNELPLETYLKYVVPSEIAHSYA